MYKCKKGKRVTVLLIALIVAVVMLPVTAFANGGETLTDVNGIRITAETTNEQLDTAWGEGAATISANTDGSYTVTMQKNISLAKYKDISFGVQFGGEEQPLIILDLNGHTITGTSIVIANYGNLTIRDGSAEKTGKVVYDGGQYLVAVNNVGYLMTVEGGTFVCNGAGSSSYNAAISTAANVTTVIDGGNFEGGNAGAVISYGDTVINGGHFEGAYGAVVKVSSDGTEGSIEFPAGSTAEVTATKMALCRIDGADDNAGKSGSFVVADGTFDAPAILGVTDQSIDKTATTTITGGNFTTDPSEFVPEGDGNAVAGFTVSGADSPIYVVGEQEIAEKAASSSTGDKIEVVAGDVSFTGVPDGVTISNSGKGDVTVDDVPVTDPVVICNHTWGEPVWNWSEDHSSATATFVCEKDESHTETVTATVTSQKTDATCYENGRTVYSATASFNGVTYTDEAIVEIACRGYHTYSQGKCTKCGAVDPMYPQGSGDSDKEDGDKDNPPMGDSSSIALGAGLLLLSSVSVAALVRKKKAN